MQFPCFLTLIFFFLFFHVFPFLSRGVVPPSQTFNYVNDGEFGPYIVEYDANYRVLPIARSPFQMCFYNTTPGEYTLALRMGTTRSESLFRWVWEANRGNPVGENATFSLGTNGNLVLARNDGGIAWQSNTANKGVVGLQVLSNGNIVLYDSKGKYIWQSFDSPTDTILVGQSLRLKGPNKLISRLSDQENKNGPYSLVLEPKRFAMYYIGKNSSKPMLYFDSTDFLFLGSSQTIDFLTFNSEPETDDAFAYELTFVTQNSGNRILSRPKYNSTLTYLRVGVDGGLRAYTFYDKVDYQAWEMTFTLFPRDSGEECGLPARCGQFGLCEDSQCVVCPSPNGLLGWNKKCAPPKPTSCKASDVTYYKIDGVDHFTSKYTKGIGPIKEDDCRRRCTSDCKCSGFFFKQVESRCWIVYDLMTLSKVENSTHLGYIKTSKI
ncbi:epidermis-specific secreted glycoprotein EP1-like [Andrographis paniculata]|uniref:epidermis-specific secreted glycoprotein EP1-like n=1 Tax=Andrographis paniculata TaxID=175694 RepID=UPI0021E8C032|nr:epidermis-specific secreted glycoprotein EP1-like [Andrographis paniculata]